MKRPKIVLFGSAGQLGNALIGHLDRLGDLVALGRFEADFRFPAALGARIADARPDVIVNAAAYTQVDLAESEVALAEAVNAMAVAALAAAAKACGALLVHYSTDYVFDGSGTRAWRETDPTNPLNVYGRTKLAGEAAIVASGCDHLIARVSWLYGRKGANFLKSMLALARERDTLRVVNDQIGAPTSVDFVARTTADIVAATLSGGDLGGIYHLAARGETSWHDYAELVIETARTAGYPVRTREIEAIASRDYPTPARRPLNSRLDTTKISAVFNVRAPDWRDDVAAMTAQLARAA